MEPVISPLGFYLLHVVDAARIVLAVIACVGLFGLVICLPLLFGEGLLDDVNPKVIVLLIAFVAFLVLCYVFIPSRDTLIHMLSRR